MEVSTSVQCPFCGQICELTLDSSVPQQRFITDCENCCRPFEMFVECQPGEVLNIWTEAG